MLLRLLYKILEEKISSGVKKYQLTDKLKITARTYKKLSGLMRAPP